MEGDRPTSVATVEPAVTLAYEAPHVRRVVPKWVWAVVGVYALILAGGLSVPLWMPTFGDPPLAATVGIMLTPFVMAWFALLLVPVRVTNRRPVAHRTLWAPLLGSGFLAGVLVLGGGAALVEWWMGFDELPLGVLLCVAAGAWVIWTVLFWIIARARRPEDVGMRLHRWLIAGSVLELLVAVPTHVVVRRREECCAGVATMSGICCGIAVMLVAFGPSVVLLYLQRARQIAPQPNRPTPLPSPVMTPFPAPPVISSALPEPTACRRRASWRG